LIVEQTLECAAFVGLDWADKEHAFCILAADPRAAAQPGILKQNPEAIAAWVTALRSRFGGRPVAICVEQSRGALIYALMGYDFLILYPVNPAQLASYRKALYPSGAKDDPTDAELLARFVREHRDQVRVWKPDDEITRSLRLLNEQRRAWVEQRVGLENELRQRLKETYPLALELLVGDLHSDYALTLLAKFPTLKQLQRASPAQLAKWLRRPRRQPDEPSTEQLLQARIGAIRQAMPLTQDRPLLDHARLVIRHLVAQIQSLNGAIVECDKQIEKRFAQHPDRELFTSFPGAGTALAPRLAAAFGTDREKFQDARDIQRMSGIAPVTRSSGKTRVVLARWACPRFLRQTFHEFARCSTKFSAWADAYLKMRTAAGDRYHVILRSLAFKWQRILFRCWKNRETYDEQRYLQRLRATGSKLVAFLPPNGASNP
jgi:transposase